MSRDDRYDLIVVGLGAMGAATLLHAHRLGLRVLGIDRFDPPHQLGSSHAETRVTRLAVGEGPQYLPFVARSHEIWRELEAETGRPLLYQSGGCIITTGAQSDEGRWNDFVTATAAVADQGGIDFRVVDPETLRAEQPAILVRDDEQIGLEPTGGIVLSEAAIAAQLELARAEGAAVHTNEVVLDIDQTGEGTVVVTSDRGRYRTGQVVLATGSWIPTMAGPADRETLTVTRQVVFWFEVEDPAVFSTDRFPFIIWVGDSLDHYLGVFPIPPAGTAGLKVVGEQFAATTDATSVDRTVSAAEIDDFYHRVVRHRLAGVTPRCVKASVCLYTNTPDDDFLIDTVPASDRILVMSPCSGHGFKHSTGLAEAVAQVVATGTSTLDLTPFARRW